MNPTPAFRRIGVNHARELLQRNDTVVLDVRDQRSYELEHIGKARNVHSHNLDQVILGTAKHLPILIYCYHGNASQTYAQMFADFGFVDVYSLDGGYEAFRNAQAIVAALNAAISDSQATLHGWLDKNGFGAGMHAVIDNHTTSLMRASRQGDIDIASELLRAGVAVNTRNADGNNALWHACLSGDLALIQLLIDAGINIDNQNSIGGTCCMLATLTGKVEVLAKLLDAGADIHLRDRDQRRAFDMTSSIACGELLRRALEIQLARPL